MERIVDLHTHSHYSRATSKNSTLEELYKWGKIKGINIIGTGDFTHPDWFLELCEKLEPAPGGLYRLKDKIAASIDAMLPPSIRKRSLYFVPTVEIATIYRKGGKVRKIHQLVVMPRLKDASALNKRLGRIGNLKADGRPVLALDSKDLLRHTLEINAEALYIPAHIWTPWFGLFGSKSGFDSLQEAYEELTPQVRAIETGLSSDPAMNARLSTLDGITITSHSDAHSPGKLGREATVLRGDPSWQDLYGAFTTNDDRLAGTIEFFPEEGKYHSDGHRICKVRLTPDQTRKLQGICPACSKPVVVGVHYRVQELADKPWSQDISKQVEYIVPLPEVLAELRGAKSVQGKSLLSEYHQLIAALGSEFDILRKVPLEALYDHSPLVGLAAERIRKNLVHRDPGYDGIFGTIKVFKDAQERAGMTVQLAML